MLGKMKEHLKKDDGVGVVEIILILVVLIFKNQLTGLVNDIFASINTKAKTIY